MDLKKIMGMLPGLMLGSHKPKDVLKAALTEGVQKDIALSMQNYIDSLPCSDGFKNLYTISIKKLVKDGQPVLMPDGKTPALKLFLQVWSVSVTTGAINKMIDEKDIDSIIEMIAAATDKKQVAA